MIWSLPNACVECRNLAKEFSSSGVWSGKLLALRLMRRGSLSSSRLARTSVLWRLLRESLGRTRELRGSVRRCPMFFARWGKLLVIFNFPFVAVANVFNRSVNVLEIQSFILSNDFLLPFAVMFLAGLLEVVRRKSDLI